MLAHPLNSNCAYKNSLETCGEGGEGEKRGGGGEEEGRGIYFPLPRRCDGAAEDLLLLLLSLLL